MDISSKRIYVAGHRGLVGSALVRKLHSFGAMSLILSESKDLDLRDQTAVRKFFSEKRPEVVFLAAAKVGGIHANDTRRAEFMYDNLMISANVIENAYRHGAEWLLNLGSSCIYPKMAPQPLEERSLLTGPLEQTNEPYAIAKIAALKLVESYNRQYGTKFFSAMPTNLYGPNDNFDLENSHVLPALIRKFHEAKVAGRPSVILWGDGSPMREFLHVDDLASACIFLYEQRNHTASDGYFVNVGTGADLSIKELAAMVIRVTQYEGDVVWDAAKPNGTPRKLMDVSRINGLGWKAKITLEQGLSQTYEWYTSQINSGQLRL